MKNLMIYFSCIFLYLLNYVSCPNATLDTRKELTLANKKKIKENSCSVQEDCEYLNICVENKCVHKRFFPITSTEALGAVLIIIGSALSNAGGIGGGGLLMPILIFFLNFNTKEAIPISKLMIFTGALTAFVMGLKNKNPFREGSAVDYNMAVVVIPLVLFGTMIGVTFNKIFPPWMILSLLTLVLCITTYKTLKKAFQLYKEEKESIAKEKNKKKIKLKSLNESNEDESLEENSTLICESEEVESGENLNLRQFNSVTRKVLLNIEFDKDKVIVPFNKICFCFVSYFAMLMITLMKGSDHLNSIIGVKTCSVMYWTVYMSYLPICLVITYIVGKKIYEEYNYRLEIGYPYHSSDIKWSKKVIVRYPLYALSAGILSGLLGIGGGTVLGPMLLDLGIHPLVSTATSNFLVLFISSSTTLQYIMNGMMNFHYGLVCTVLSTVGSYLGTLVIQSYLEKTKRNSVLVFTLGFVLLISTVFIPGHTFASMIKNIHNGVDIWQFGAPC